MKNLKKFEGFINEWLDSPGSIDVPGQSYETSVKRRNYQSADPTMPETIDAMYEAAYFHDFLDESGKSEEFNKFLDGEKKTGSDITEYLKTTFQEKNLKKEK
jgi:hypothetical protein